MATRTMDGHFPLQRLEQLPVAIDRSAVEAAMRPFLVTGPGAEPIWRADYRRRFSKSVRRMLKRLIGAKKRDQERIQSEYGPAWAAGHAKYDTSLGARKPAAWVWGDRHLTLDGVAAARLRAPMFAAALAALKPRTVLEVGCGNGINLLSLAGTFPDVQFTGLDLTEEGIAAAKKLQADGTLPPALAEYIPLPKTDPTAFRRIDFVQGSAADLPFADGQFDLVFTVLAIEQMERIRDQALREIARVSGGHVMMLEPLRDANMRGFRRLYTVSRNYLRGSIADLPSYGLEPLWATDDFPQEVFLGSPLVLSRKRGA
jgi:SAM-dependent methyltransferase